MSDGFEVDLTSLMHAAEGVNGVISDMQHSKVSDIGDSGVDYGDENLTSVMSDFCSRWERLLLPLGDRRRALDEGRR